MRWLGALVLSLWLAAGALAQTFVQKNVNQDSSGTTHTTFTVTSSAFGAGNLVAGFITAGANSATATVKDSAGTSYTMVPSSSGVSDVANGNQAWMFYLAPGSQSGGATSLTVTFNGAMPFVGFEFQEWSGIQSATPLDQSNITNVTTASTTQSGTAVTTTVNGELIYAGVVPDGGAPGTISAGTNVAYTLRNNGGPDFVADESFVQTTAGSIQGQFKNSGSVTAQLGTMTFKPAAGGGPTCPTTLALLGVGC